MDRYGESSAVALRHRLGPDRQYGDGLRLPIVDDYMVAYRRTQSSAGNSTDGAVSSAKLVDSGNTGLSRPASSVHDFSMNAGRSSTKVPFELINNHVNLEVMLDGKGPYRFAFDTGGVNVIDPAVASEIAQREPRGSSGGRGGGHGVD